MISHQQVGNSLFTLWGKSTSEVFGTIRFYWLRPILMLLTRRLKKNNIATDFRKRRKTGPQIAKHRVMRTWLKFISESWRAEASFKCEFILWTGIFRRIIFQKSRLTVPFFAHRKSILWYQDRRGLTNQRLTSNYQQNYNGGSQQSAEQRKLNAFYVMNWVKVKW